jgi:hypothetical protein
VTDAVQLHEAAVGHSVVQRVDPVTRVVAVSPPATPRGSGVRVGRVASGAWLARDSLLLVSPRTRIRIVSAGFQVERARWIK